MRIIRPFLFAFGMLYYLKMHFQKELPQMADEIVYKKMTRKADKGLEGKVVAKHGK